MLELKALDENNDFKHYQDEETAKAYKAFVDKLIAALKEQLNKIIKEEINQSAKDKLQKALDFFQKFDWEKCDYHFENHPQIWSGTRVGETTVKKGGNKYCLQEVLPKALALTNSLLPYRFSSSHSYRKASAAIQNAIESHTRALENFNEMFLVKATKKSAADAIQILTTTNTQLDASSQQDVIDVANDIVKSKLETQSECLEVHAEISTLENKLSDYCTKVPAKFYDGKKIIENNQDRYYHFVRQFSVLGDAVSISIIKNPKSGLGQINCDDILKKPPL